MPDEEERAHHDSNEWTDADMPSARSVNRHAVPVIGVARRVQEGFVPLMRDLEGLQGYYLADGGEDVVITVSMFDSADAALVSNTKAADWVRHNVLEFARGMPEVMVGDVLVAEVK